MRPGEFVGGIFEIERVAGEGGMGVVYRARWDNLPVAVKILHGAGIEGRARFLREAKLLASLTHPAIVKYVAHGFASSGEPYLVMEWLEGEDLGSRLSRARLTTSETIALGRRIADGLAAAHAQGVVHRDVKPNNIFLPFGDIALAKLLDFGIARASTETRIMTRTGTFMGTPGYVAPEQARGAKDIDGRADVFSLGCVLFECLTGRPAFAAEHVIAVLAKILFEEAPRVRELEAAVPPGVDVLVSEMLSKDPGSRPATAGVVSARLMELGLATKAPAPGEGLRDRALTSAELRVASVVLSPRTCGFGSSGYTRTLTPEEVEAPARRLREVTNPFGAHVDVLADGTVVAVLAGNGNAVDQAAQAARCAIAMRAALPDETMALATGRGVLSKPLPVGDVLDRAARRLRAEPTWSPESERAAGDRAILIDDVTAGLLDRRFQIQGGATGLELIGERSSEEAGRTLLGKSTQCVGRERELRLLRDLFNECVDESLPRAAVITGQAGIGKSRIGYELLQWIRQRGEPVEVWIAHGEFRRLGSPFSLATELLRRAAGILESDPLDTQRLKLRARVSRSVAAPDQARVTEFLGEMIGTIFTGEESVQLQVARQNPASMNEQVRRAWIDLIAAECSASPLIIALDDLHWGDAPSLSLIESSLRVVVERPLFVLALARTEDGEMLPHLQKWRGAQEVRLQELSRKACERLVRLALGESAPPDEVERLVVHAAGNVFYLEELIRAVVDGRGRMFPETVLTMVQSRLEALEHDARRILRAGSIFGRVFWSGGVSALLGEPRSTIEEWLQVLVEREFVTFTDSRFSSEKEFMFRHGLVREGAYGMLTSDDRSLGHRLAGEWLESMGVHDAAMLADHFERGGAIDKARASYRCAMDSATAAGLFCEAAEIGDRLALLASDPVTRITIELAIVRALIQGRKFEEASRRIARLSHGDSPHPITLGILEFDLWRRIYQLEVDRGLRRQSIPFDAKLISDADKLGEPVLRCEARLALSGVCSGEQALQLAGEAVELASACGEALEFAARIRRYEVNYDSNRRDLNLVEEDLKKALAIAVGSGSIWQRVHIEGDLASFEAEQGRTQEAIERMARLVVDVEANGMRGELRLFLQNLSALLLRANRSAEAAEVAGRAADLATEAGDPGLRGIALS
ncbi:MAG: protein kinase, partial [Polyangiaceae bacterium]|nr:protein kinase [Polyangiaceae bacterium]